MRYAAMLLACAAAACAQYQPPLISPELKDFLQLTESQAEDITRLNQGYDTLLQQKYERLYQVQREIDQAIREPVPDTTAVGLGYVELESIRRGLNEELGRIRTAGRALLNDSQKARLKLLEDALALQPMVMDAQCASLLTPPEMPQARWFDVSNSGLPVRTSVVVYRNGSSGGGCGGYGLVFTGGGATGGPAGRARKQ